MRTKKVLLTPELAKEYLSHNYEENRDIRPTVYLRYADDIRNGRWNQDDDLLEYEPILFNKDGRMTNGQHRCHAVIEADTPIFVGVKTNVSNEIYEYLDGGERRRTSDFMSGLADKKNLASFAKAVCSIESGVLPLRSALLGKLKYHGRHSLEPSRSMILEKLSSDSDALSEILLKADRVQRKTKISRSQIAIALYVLVFTDRGSYIDRWVDDVCSSVPTSSTNILFREFMLRARSEGKRLDRVTNIACILHAYDHFLPGTETKMFNKYMVTLSKYDKLVEEKRKEIQAA